METDPIKIIALIISGLSFGISYFSLLNSKRTQRFTLQEKKQSILNELNSTELLCRQNFRKSKSLLYDLEYIRKAKGNNPDLQWIFDKISNFISASELVVNSISDQRKMLMDIDDRDFRRGNLENLMTLFNKVLSSINKNKTEYLDLNAEIDEYETQIDMLLGKINTTK